MSLEGRINVDCLFHDRDGTASLKVVNLDDADAYTSGAIVFWSGTCGTSSVTLDFINTGYRNASGSVVSVAPGGSNGRVVFLATGNGGELTQANGPLHMISFGHACVSSIDEQESVSVAAYDGTTRYTVIVFNS